MESPLNLLKLAVGENDSDIRTSQVIKACKIITTILPFDRKNHSLVEESELMKYLLLALPLNPRSIDMIIVSMIKKFKKLHYFLKELWFAFTSIAQLEEPRTSSTMKSESAMRLYQNDVKKLLKLATLKDLDELAYNATSRVSEFCDAVTENKEWIKLATLEYVDQVIEIYNKELKASIAFKPDIAELLKKFVIFSPSDKVIIRVCAIIEKVSFIEKNSMLNHEIEQLVLNKQSMVLDSNFASKANIEDTPRVKGKVKLKRALSKIKEEKQESAENRKSRTFGDGTPKSNRSPGHSPMKRSTSRNIEPTSLGYLDDNSPAIAETVESRLEKWLSEGEMDEVPIIAKNAYIYNMFKNPGNYEIILSFIFDPQAYPIGDCWKEHYPSLTDGLEESSLNQSGVSNHLKLQRLKEDKFLHPYILRSYKTMLAFCDPGNMKYFILMDSSAFENYFSFLYACLNTRDDSACNFNHIAKVTEFLLRKEAEVCVNYLIYYNIIYKFIQNLEFPLIEQFFFTLFNSSYTHVRIGDDAYRKIMKYCEIVSFFSDLAQAMLVGSKSFDLKKSEVYYKPLGVESLVNGAMKKSDIVGMFDDNPLTERRESSDCFLEDELNGTNLDIDGLYSITQSSKKLDKKKIMFAKKAVQRSHSQSVINRYASLREKYLRKERALTESNEGLDQYLDSRNTIGTPRRQNSKPIIVLQRQKTGFQLEERKNSIVIKSKLNTDLNLNTMSPKNALVSSPTSALSPTNILASRQSLPINPVEGALKVDDKQTLSTMNGGLRSARGLRAATEEDEDYNSGFTSSKNALKTMQNWNSKSNVDSKRPIHNYYSQNYVAPERITLAQELINDVMTPETAKQLNVLYPISSLNRVENEIDREAKKPDYTVNNIRQHEQFALQICNFFETLFRKALFSPTEEDEEELKEKTKNEDKGKRRRIGLKRKLGFFENDYSPFWNAIFISNNTVFEKLLRNYLLKIKIHNLEETNSGYSAGLIVNMVLSKCGTHPQLNKFFTTIHNICKDHLRFLCKVIIQSHAWPNRKDPKVYLQNYEVTEPLGAGRILLVETLYWILHNELKSNSNSKILYEINDTCWHTLIVWFFSKKTNNAYLRLFFTILEMTFQRSSEKFILNLLFKLEILSSMYRVYGEVYLNNVLIKDNYNESIICYMKKIAMLIESTARMNEKYATLRSQLDANISWSHLKLKLCPRPEKKKETTLVPKGSKLKGRDSTFSSMRTTPRTENRNSLLQRTSLLTNKRDSVIKMPPIATSNFK